MVSRTISMYKLLETVDDLYIENTKLAIASPRKMRAARAILEDRIFAGANAAPAPRYAEMAANKYAILTKGIEDNPGTQSATFPTISETKITVHITYARVEGFAVVLGIRRSGDASRAEA